MPSLVWSNVGIDIGTLGTAQTVSAITLANPAVVTYVGADPTSGDYIALFSAGMTQVNSRVFRSANVVGGSNTLELEGVNSTAYGTFTSGTMQPITWGTSLSTVRSITASGGEPRSIDDSDIHSDAGREIPGQSTAITLTMVNRFAVGDAGLLALNAASIAKTQHAVRIRFSDGTKLTYLVYISAPLNPTGQAQGLVETSVTMNAQALPVAYST